MAGTTVPFGDPKAQKKWSGSLFLDTVKESYFDRKFVAESDNAVIQRLTDLESDAGDTMTYDLSVQLRNKPTTGDNRLEGKEENLRFFSDEVYIDQMRHGVSAGGKMSRKSTAHNMRRIARDRLSDYWSKYVDEINFIYLSGARGISEDFTEDETWAGHAGNPIQAPDAGHILYGGDATGTRDRRNFRNIFTVAPSRLFRRLIVKHYPAHQLCQFSPRKLTLPFLDPQYGELQNVVVLCPRYLRLCAGGNAMTTVKQIEAAFKKAEKAAHADLLANALSNDPIGACWVNPDYGEPYCKETHRSVYLKMDAMMRNNPDPRKRGFCNFTEGGHCTRK